LTLVNEVFPLKPLLLQFLVHRDHSSGSDEVTTRQKTLVAGFKPSANQNLQITEDNANENRFCRGSLPHPWAAEPNEFGYLFILGWGERPREPALVVN
jgi:hypothetical protein